MVCNGSLFIFARFVVLTIQQIGHKVTGRLFVLRLAARTSCGTWPPPRSRVRREARERTLVLVLEQKQAGRGPSFSWEARLGYVWGSGGGLTLHFLEPSLFSLRLNATCLSFVTTGQNVYSAPMPGQASNSIQLLWTHWIRDAAKAKVLCTHQGWTSKAHSGSGVHIWQESHRPQHGVYKNPQTQYNTSLFIERFHNSANMAASWLSNLN